MLEDQTVDTQDVEFSKAAYEPCETNNHPDCWLLKTYLRAQGIEGVELEDGRAMRIPDPFNPAQTVIVRDAVAFGFRPVIEGARPPSEYIEHWRADGIPLLDLDHEIDILIEVTRQGDCPILPDDLAQPNPHLVGVVQLRDEELSEALRLNKRFAFTVIDSKSVIHVAKSGNMLTKQTAKDLIASETYIEEVECTDNKGKTKHKTVVKKSFDAWMGSSVRRTYEGVEFAPRGITSTNDPADRNKLNLWTEDFKYFEDRGGFVERSPTLIIPADEVKQVNRIFAHYHDVFHNGCDKTFNWEMDWCAHMLCRPHEKTHAHIVNFDGGGTGKDIIQLMWRHRIIGEKYSKIVSGSEGLTDKFNALQETCVLLFGNEVSWGGSRAARDVLFNDTAGVKRLVERKGVDKTEVNNYTRYRLASNDKRPAPVERGDRRFLILKSRNIAADYPDGNKDAGYRDYFTKLAGAANDHSVVAQFVEAILRRDISDFNIYRAPDTSDKYDVLERGLDDESKWLLSIARQGAVIDDDGHQGFTGDLSADCSVEIEKNVVYGSAQGFLKQRDRALATKCGQVLKSLQPATTDRQHFHFPPLPDFRKWVSDLTGLPLDRCS